MNNLHLYQTFFFSQIEVICVVKYTIQIQRNLEVAIAPRGLIEIARYLGVSTFCKFGQNF